MTSTAIAPAPSIAAHERRVTRAAFAAGVTTFAAMYSAQALLPSLSAAFGATPARAASAVSLTTGVLALAIVPVSALSARFGHARVMIASTAGSALIGLLLPWSPNLDVLLAGRALQGLVVAGVPAVAMAYLAEEIHGDRLGAAMGVYIAGTTLGGLGCRVLPALALEVMPWRWAAETAAVAAAACAVWFLRALPAPRPADPQPLRIRSLTRDLGTQLRSPTLLALFGLAFVLMGGFVSVYNFLGYRLTRSPFELSPGVAGFVFLLYLAGTVTSTLAGRWVNRIGRVRVLMISVAVMCAGVLITLPDRLPAVLLGVLLCTAGFFGAHTVAGAWVGTAAIGNRSAAGSLYMFCYYAGSSVIGALAGVVFGRYGWAGLAGYVAALTVVAAALIAIAATGERAAR
ncbi:MFS transporter [Nocardia aurantia]|uniref:Inner membrane transport protein YnfM n=1 Tax=Nocardia aurantia TaxID=2585199 RepID=A0A7K0DP86_9NOCA|nr:MFS transporter [Nocardia aurantia]MQY26604.1 Inner membrane transport protein YnfM [Nocardia aurantia]